MKDSAQAEGDHIAFYRFIRLSDPDAVAARLSCVASNLLGTVLLATEGVNGHLAGTSADIDDFLRTAAEDEITGNLFRNLVVKRTRWERVPYSRLKIKVKDEIVPLGVEDVDVPGRVNDVAARDVAPTQWRELIAEPDVVVLDNRNSFEFEVGRFAGAVDPGVVNFRDFAAYVEGHAEQWRADGKRIAMYCTGGIRCEKASPWMQDLGLDVYQLQGGILNYFAQLPDADADFEGECFVFDNRVTLDTHLADAGRDRAEIDGQSR